MHASMNLDLFGLCDQKGLNDPEADKPLVMTSDSLDILVDDLAGYLVKSLTSSLLDVHRLRDGEGNAPKPIPGKKVSPVLKEFWENLIWVFGLSEYPASLPFDAAMHLRDNDAEVMKTQIGKTFQPEIQQFYTAFAAWDPVGAKAVAKKLKEFCIIETNVA